MVMVRKFGEKNTSLVIIIVVCMSDINNSVYDRAEGEFINWILMSRVHYIVECISGINDSVYERAEGEFINWILNATSA